MDTNVKRVNDFKINRTIASLRNNNINAFKVHDTTELIAQIDELLKEGDTVSCGGSNTLFETGIIDHLRSGRYNFLDRYDKTLNPNTLKELYRKIFYADAYFSSANAITEKGEIFNVDCEGNRVAPLLYGPDKIIIVIGVNKIVRDLDEALYRVQTLSAPANNMRMGSRTPCVKTGKCMDCSSPDRICCDYTLIKRQKYSNRFYVFILNEDYGY